MLWRRFGLMLTDIRIRLSFWIVKVQSFSANTTRILLIFIPCEWNTLVGFPVFSFPWRTWTNTISKPFRGEWVRYDGAAKISSNPTASFSYQRSFIYRPTHAHIGLFGTIENFTRAVRPSPNQLSLKLHHLRLRHTWSSSTYQSKVLLDYITHVVWKVYEVGRDAWLNFFCWISTFTYAVESEAVVDFCLWISMFVAWAERWILVVRNRISRSRCLL